MRTQYQNRMVWGYNRVGSEQLDHKKEDKYSLEKANGNVDRARAATVFASGVMRNLGD